MTDLPVSDNSWINLCLRFSQNGTVKCEEDTAWLRCNEYKHISIISAFWGRRNFGLCTEHTGNLKFNQYCPTTPLFLTKVKDACEGTTMCEIRCTKFFFNDQSCADVYKYLEVYYKCIEVINGHEVVNEDNLLNANYLGWANKWKNKTNFLSDVAFSWLFNGCNILLCWKEFYL